MSDSTPHQTESGNITRKAYEHRRRKRKEMPVWWSASVILHTVFLASLLYISPLREAVLPQPEEDDTEISLSSDRIEEIAEYINELNEEELRYRVEELRQIQQEMESIENEAKQEFDKFEQMQAEKAPETIEESLAEVKQAQEEAQKTQEQAEAKQDEAAKKLAEEKREEAEKIQNEAKKDQASVKEKQKKAEAAMTKAARAMAWAGAEDLRVAQETAAELQNEATQAQANAEHKQHQAKRHIEEAKKDEQKAEDYQKKADALAEKVAEAQKKVDEIAAEKKKADEKVTEAKKEADQAQKDAKNAAEEAKKVAKAEDAEKKKAEQQAKEAAKDAREATEDVKKAEAHAKRTNDRLKQVNRDLDKREQALAKEKKRAEGHTKKAEDHRKAAVEQQAEAKKAQQEAKKKQELATKAQEEVVKKYAEAKKAMAEQMAKADASAAETETAEPLDGKDMVELYEEAKKTEETIAETYKEIRATELSMLRDLPIEEARRNTDVAKPIRPELDEKVLRENTRTGKALEQRKAEVTKALAETSSMIALAHTMREMATQYSEAKNGKGMNVEYMSERAEHLAKLEKAAAENEQVKASDLTALMTNGGGDGNDGQQENLGSKDTSSSSGTGSSGPIGHPKLSNKTPLTTTGRRITAYGDPASWMAIDSWYWIGPFPNPSRVNIDKKFPPESVVDLDATYLGKNGRPIKWTFQQDPDGKFAQPPNPEPYGIWYAYSELYLDQARDLWVAVGSDDKSKIWVNDQVIWESVPWHKAWRIDEGYRKVHFRKGHNRILFRLENGHYGMGMSFTIHTAKPE